MRKIGIHKMGFESLNHDSSLPFVNDDKNGMFTEVNLLMSAFRANGIEVNYVDTFKENKFNSYDILFIFNGFENSTSNFEKLNWLTKEFNYIITDSRFYNAAVENEEWIDNYFVQSDVKMFDKPTYNSQLHKLPIYETNFYDNVKHVKNDRLVFGGSIRERRQRIEKLLGNNLKFDLLLYDKDAGIDNRLPINAYKMLLGNYSYGIVIINPLDIKIGSITWRYYEYIANKVLTFVDVKSDPYNLLLPKGHFMYVGSQEELVSKINILSKHESLRKVFLNDQSQRITLDVLSGRLFVKSLIESRSLNVIRK